MIGMIRHKWELCKGRTATATATEDRGRGTGDRETELHAEARRTRRRATARDEANALRTPCHAERSFRRLEAQTKHLGVSVLVQPDPSTAVRCG